MQTYTYTVNDFGWLDIYLLDSNELVKRLYIANTPLNEMTDAIEEYLDALAERNYH